MGVPAQNRIFTTPSFIFTIIITAALSFNNNSITTAATLQDETASASATVSASTQIPATYHTYIQYTQWIKQIASEYPNYCKVESIGKSLDGRDIWAIQLAGPGTIEPDKRPALLITANIDGDRVIGSEVAVNIIENLLAQATGKSETAQPTAAADNNNEEITKAEDADAETDYTTITAKELLASHTLYIVPRVNPDAAEMYFRGTKNNYNRNKRPDDIDRDTLIDEDGPDDLNGDGVITLMRVYDPEKADMIADENEPRLNVKPDMKKGERPLFYIDTEGIDNDNDGQYNEDPTGGVDLNMNFMHGYQEHADGAGIHQVSEPESLALLKYALAHQNIAAAITFGKHDNLTNAPDGKGTYDAGTPKNIDSGDVELYKDVSEIFKKITGLNKIDNSNAGGAFFEWAYAQYGIPSFTTPLWTLPEEPKKENDADGKNGTSENDADTPPAEGQREARQFARPGGGGGGRSGSGGRGGGRSGGFSRSGGGGGGGAPDDAATTPPDSNATSTSEGLTPSGIGDISKETIDELIAAAEAAGFPVNDEMMANITPEQVEQYAQMSGVQIRRVKPDSDKNGKAKNAEEAAWLKYNDEKRNGAGFVNWQQFEHPQLGKVEIGGWTPYFKTNPPAEEIKNIADKQTEFVLYLTAQFPKISLEEPQIKRLAQNLYEIKTTLTNEGGLPAGTAMARRNQRARPYIVSISTENQNIINGTKINKVWSIPAHGGKEKFKWIINAPDNSDITIKVYSEKYGQFEKVYKLSDNQ